MNKKVVISLFLAFLMISSIAGFIIGFPLSNQDDSRIKYLGYTFVQTPNGYLTYIGDSQLIISTDPRQVKLYQNMESLTLQELNAGSKIYFTFNPSENIQNTFSYFNANIRPRLNSFIPACTKDAPECADLPLITCDNASPSAKVIQVQLANPPSISYENNCLLIEGSQYTIEPLFDSLIIDLLLY